MKRIIPMILLPIMSCSIAGAQSYVDQQGVLRWRSDHSEIHGFGVNYSTPFAHAFRMAQRLGVSHEEAIKQDLYHFARLDLDLYRVHVWDTEISDTLGNLLQNEHLRLFDFAVSEMKKRGMKFVVTPIAFWGNGWPEPDYPTPGFSHRYGKEACLVEPACIRAQHNYLSQFLEHVNPYTGIAYKDEPYIIAFEVSNEPHHQETVEEVTGFINGMVDAMRSTGTTTPIFYNMSHSIHLYRAYLEANVQGGTFQWYPAGLVANRQINGNFLPHVNEYFIPFGNDPDFQQKAKLVYEFDAADVEGNYMYPAMARSFRQAGMQLAAHFDYDAMFLAPYNTNYGTHYMSLPYAPQKAISLKVASAVFREMPRYSDPGPYPGNNIFGNFRIDYSSDLVELVSDQRFFYSNNTRSVPARLDELREVTGYGNSPLVKYDGKGAYFLDRLQEGVWRLEVMPDAHWLSDPYGRVSPRRQVAAVHHTERAMQLELPGLGENFLISPINAGNNFQPQVSRNRFMVMPGVYILQARGNPETIKPGSIYRNIRLDEFVAPASNLQQTLVKNLTPLEFSAGTEAKVLFEVISPQRPGDVRVVLYSEQGGSQFVASYLGKDIYEAVIPAEYTLHGIVSYFILLDLDEGLMTFPAGDYGRPFDWDFYLREPYRMHFVEPPQPVVIWQALEDHERSMIPWERDINLRPLAGENNAVLFYDLEQVPFSQDGPDSTHVHTFKFSFRDKVSGRRQDLAKKEHLVVRGRSLDRPVILHISLIDNGGNVFTWPLTLESGQDHYQLPLADHRPGRFAMVPRPYPEFKPWFAGIENHRPLHPEDLETLQVTLPDQEAGSGLRFFLEKISLE